MLGVLKLAYLGRWRQAVSVAAILIAAAMAFGVPAQADGPRTASMVVDANTGAVLHNSGGDKNVYPASLTKMMTLYMTFELIEMGRLNYGSKIKMTEAGAAVAPSKLGLDPGEELTVLEAIKALVTKSANDVAVALAQHIGGTESNFARLMTQKARQLGMANTTFRNASGLPDPDQTTTARDMITLGLRLQDDFPKHYRLFSTRTFSFRGKNYRNHNTLLHRYAGTDGIKTGYTRASGFNLVSSVRRDGKHVVAAVFGGKTAASRNAKMQQIINSALPKASRNVTRKPALVARAAPQPQPATPPRQVAEAPRQQPSPSTPAARERGADIAVAKVRAVRIDADSQAPRPSTGNVQPQIADPAASKLPGSAIATAQGEAFPRFVPETGALRPSTLQAQAARLEMDEPAPRPQPVAAVRSAPSTAPSARAGARGPFEIQIGAFGDEAEAERRMSAARQRAGGMLDGYRAVSLPVQSGGSKFYRARFRGFDATAANETCSRLKNLKIDCFVTRAQ